jgi:hypothetical protein
MAGVTSMDMSKYMNMLCSEAKTDGVCNITRDRPWYNAKPPTVGAQMWTPWGESFRRVGGEVSKGPARDVQPQHQRVPLVA